ncbi:MAG TPA: hypothetical protein VF170_19370, partial [Planctomycetaceae bacterium]
MNARKNSAGRRGPFFGPVLILALSAAAAAEDFGPPFPAVAPPDFASARQADGPADGEAFGHVPAAEAGLTPSDSLDDLRGRIEALERQNEELLRRLDRDGGPPSGVEAGSGGLDASSDASAVSSTPSGASGTAKVDAGDGWYPIGSDLEMTGSWNNGLEFATRNKDFRVHVGGRIQFDTIFWDGSDAFVGTGPPF